MTNQVIYRSPLFYVGDKYKLLPTIKHYFPKYVNRFIEPFTGGGSVFLNIKANEYLLNDINENVINIHRFLIKSASNPTNFFDEVYKKIIKYGLSRSYLEDVVPIELKKRWKKTYYAKFNKQGYERLKADYNKSENKDILDLYLLLIYGFNRMLRFNSNGEFNLPVGNVDFNNNVYNALISYFSIVKSRKITLFNLDFVDFLMKIDFKENDFVYFDPPYLITFSEYNKLWSEKKEFELIEILHYLNNKNVKFAISNIVNYKGRINKIFSEWSKKFNVININSNYISYHDNSTKSFNEVLVTNYKISEKQISIFDFITDEKQKFYEISD